jgi:predicted membrane protein
MENKKNVLFVACSIVLMAGGGLLLERTLNIFYRTPFDIMVILLSLLSVFLYIAGAVLMGRCTNKSRSHRSYVGMHNGTVFALLLIAAGMLLLGFNTGYLPLEWRNFFFSWPMLLLVIGFMNVCRFRFISGIIIVAAGVFFFLSKATAAYFPELFISTYWPGLIIILGINLLLFTIILKPKKNGWQCIGGYRKDIHRANAGVDRDEKINYRFVFSGMEQVILDPVFRGGNIEAIFGGMELDLRRTSLPEGDTFLHVKAIFGGVVIIAPDSWEIEIHPKPFAGGVEDSRIKNGDRDKSRKLVIIAECAFGGIEIK